MAIDKLSFNDAVGAFAPGQSLQAVLILTYNFDGRWFEETLAPDIFERAVTTMLLLRDRQAVIAEAPSVRYHRANAAFSTRIFHPKLVLLVAEDRARAIIGSANMTRGGLERNLELGSVFDIGPEGGSRSFFKSLLAYLRGPLRQETAGGGLSSLDDIATALQEAIGRASSERERSQHVLLHNYDTPLWDQLLKALPHRVLRRAIIVSPFYEPDSARGPCEDPPWVADDGSVFDRLFSDFDFDAGGDSAAISVYFQEDAGQTTLPVGKLRNRKNRLKLHYRLAVSDDARLLHGKLMVLEGSNSNGRLPFLAMLHGSPNFTSAALLRTPPTGNAELAVLTWLPPETGTARVEEAMGLGELFAPVTDWESLRPKVIGVPRPGQSPFTMTDAFFRVAEKTVTISVQHVPPGAVRFRLLAGLDTGWTVIAEGPWCVGESGKTVSVAGLTANDPTTNLLVLCASCLRLEVMADDGTVIAGSESPLNVDCPEQFCGMCMTGPLLLTLDQRIAQVGAAMPISYREQQRWLERLRQCDHPGGPTLTSHQADLDRFFRNLHSGLKGIERKLTHAPRSEFTLRNTLRQLSSWCNEAIADGSKVASDECRVFLLDRLAAKMLAAIERAAEVPILSAQIGSMAEELGLKATTEAVEAWLEPLATSAIGVYVKTTSRRFGELKQAIRG